MMEGSRQDDGSYSFDCHKIQTKYSPGLKSFLMGRGIKMFLSIFPFQDGCEVPRTVFQKLMDSHIELRRSRIHIRNVEREAVDLKYENKRLCAEYEDAIEALEKENEELRIAAKCCLRPKSKKSFLPSYFACCLPLPLHTKWKRRRRMSHVSEDNHTNQ